MTGPRPRVPAAVVFDLDGLLVDSEPLWRRVERAVFAEVGVDVSEEEARSTTGLRIDEVVAHWASRRPWIGPAVQEVVDRVVAGMVAGLRVETVPQPGVEHALALASGLGVPLALASSSPAAVIDAALDHLGWRAVFAVVESAEHLPRGKPDPGVYLAAAGRLGVDPGACTAVEDSPNGARAAKAAGMRCVAVPAAEHRDEVAGVADVVLASLASLRTEHLLR